MQDSLTNSTQLYCYRAVQCNRAYAPLFIMIWRCTWRSPIPSSPYHPSKTETDRCEDCECNTLPEAVKLWTFGLFWQCLSDSEIWESLAQVVVHRPWCCGFERGIGSPWCFLDCTAQLIYAPCQGSPVIGMFSLPTDPSCWRFSIGRKLRWFGEGWTSTSFDFWTRVTVSCFGRSLCGSKSKCEAWQLLRFVALHNGMR